MGRPAKEPASPSTLAPALLRFVEARGADAAALAQRCGLERDASAHDEVAVTASQLAVMLAGAADVLAEPHVALRLPGEAVYRRYDAVALACRAAPTVRDVLDIHARYAALVLPQLEARVDESGGETRFIARVHGHPRGLGLPSDEYLIALVLGRCRRGSAIAPLRVSLSAPRPRDLGPLYVAFGTREVDLGAEAVEIVFASSDAGALMPDADPTLLATAEHLASSALAAAPRAGRFAETVLAKIEAKLDAKLDANAVASALHMSVRTFQRRLDDEGTRFSELYDRARELRARRLLEGTALPLAEIAYRSGFADLATFSRAFKRWTGVPPGAFRRRAASGKDPSRTAPR
jgi:AraC-like DNA-binding protein